MSISTLEEAQRLYKLYPKQVSIEREVRYYATIGNTRYWLKFDWTLEKLERKLWARVK